MSTAETLNFLEAALLPAKNVEIFALLIDRFEESRRLEGKYFRSETITKMTHHYQITAKMS